MNDDNPKYSQIIIDGLEEPNIILKCRSSLKEYTATVDNIGKMIKKDGDKVIECRGNVLGDDHLEYVKIRRDILLKIACYAGYTLKELVNYNYHVLDDGKIEPFTEFVDYLFKKK